MKDLKELERKSVGFENDNIFLLSIEEYEKYKDKIPIVKCWWWLRSLGYNQYRAAIVLDGGSTGYAGYLVNRGNSAVRPTLKIDNLESSNLKFINDNTLIYCGVTWVKIDEDLYIAETPIAFHRFDEKTNDYATSEIRQFLLDWYEKRKDW